MSKKAANIDFSHRQGGRAAKSEKWEVFFFWLLTFRFLDELARKVGFFDASKSRKTCFFGASSKIGGGRAEKGGGRAEKGGGRPTRPFIDPACCFPQPGKIYLSPNIFTHNTSPPLPQIHFKNSPSYHWPTLRSYQLGSFGKQVVVGNMFIT